MQSLEELARQQLQNHSLQQHHARAAAEKDSLLEIEKLLYIIPDGRYLLQGREESYIVKKRSDKTNKDPYGREMPVVEIEPLRDSVPLTRNNIPYGVRGFCFPASKDSYVHIDDVDTYRVNYHENLHIRIYRTNPNHPEWEIRMLEDWRLGEEKR